MLFSAPIPLLRYQAGRYWLISCLEIVFGKSGRKKQNEFLLILSDYENKQYTMRRLFCLFVIFLHLGRIAIMILLPKTRNLEDGQG